MDTPLVEIHIFYKCWTKVFYAMMSHQLYLMNAMVSHQFHKRGAF